MKIEQLLEVQAEIIPRDVTQNAAENIVRQFIRTAQYEAGGNSRATREIAHKLATRFHSNVLAAIDSEMEFSQLKTFNERVYLCHTW
jgi:hypothetical protein